MAVQRELTEEEEKLVRMMTRSSWGTGADAYRDRDTEGMVSAYAPDAISIPANLPAMRGHAELRAWYAKRMGSFEMNVESEVDSIDIVGDVAVMVGIFRVTRRPEKGVAGLDHGGRWLAVMKRVNGEWKMWRDMDSPSPDADVFYDRVPRGR